MTKPENSSIRRSKVGEQRTTPRTLVMNEGRPGGRSVALKNEEKRTKPIMAQIAQALTSLPRHACRSITFDRRSEFVDWPHLQAEVGTQTWFCEAQSPWQKGRTREH